MKLVIFGANGGTGQELLRQALAAGHEVVAAVRRPEELEAFKSRARLEKVSFEDPSSVARAVAGQDAVISALGLGGFRASTRPTSLYSHSTRVIMGAMKSANVKRLLVISSGGTERDDRAPRFYLKLIRPALINNYLDMARMEAILEEHPEIDWTIVRPTYLLDGPSKPYRVVDRKVGGGAFKIHRVDLAAFLLAEAQANAWVHKHPTLGY